MAKRVVFRVGDIIKVQLDNGKIGFFQYVVKDESQLFSAVIRVFKTHYLPENKVCLNDIIHDEVDFYTHAFLRIGWQVGIWEKVGHAEILNKEALENLIFGTCDYDIFDPKAVKLVQVDPLHNWTIWKINNERIDIGSLSEDFHNKIIWGAVIAPKNIKYRIQYGYFNNTHAYHDIIKRIPRPEVYSYVKFDLYNEEVYLCFHGNDFDKGVIPINGKFHKITKDDAISKTLEITNKKFSDTNWKNQDFITEEEFNTAWDSIK